MSAPTWAVKGARVVCINGAWQFSQRPTLGERFETWLRGDPVRGRVYVINEVLMIDSEPYVFLRGWRLNSHWLRAFRPLVPERTEAEDLAHFKPLLNVDQFDAERFSRFLTDEDAV